MKKNLPYLNQERLDIIFSQVYDFLDKKDIKLSFNEDKFSQFLEMLKSMQLFNYHHRRDDTNELFLLLYPEVFDFEINSDATTAWLSLILAIKDLYGFSEEKFISVIKQITVRN